MGREKSPGRSRGPSGLFEEAERLIAADPIGTQELIVRSTGTSRPPSPGLREQPRSPSK